MNRNELYHYGVIGMKWGVRRYQNYDGTYTQAGLKKYNGQREKYDAAKANYKAVKTNYKSGTATKQEVSEAKGQMKEETRKLKDSYNHLKLDKLGDEGKKLYAQGERITYNSQVAETVATGAGVAAYLLYSAGNTNAAIGVGAAGAAASVGMTVVNEWKAKRLRAFYGHSGWKG